MSAGTSIVTGLFPLAGSAAIKLRTILVELFVTSQASDSGRKLPILPASQRPGISCAPGMPLLFDR